MKGYIIGGLAVKLLARKERALTDVDLFLEGFRGEKPAYIDIVDSSELRKKFELARDYLEQFSERVDPGEIDLGNLNHRRGAVIAFLKKHGIELYLPPPEFIILSKMYPPELAEKMESSYAYKDLADITALERVMSEGGKKLLQNWIKELGYADLETYKRILREAKAGGYSEPI